MIATLEHLGQTYLADLTKPLDISLPLSSSTENPIAWYQEQPVIAPVVMGDWIGKVSEGESSTNFNNVFFNPHAHGTHTECLGHITHDFYSVSDTLKSFLFFAEVVSIAPEPVGQDLVISRLQLESAVKSKPDAIVIRTLPNLTDKTSRNYSHSNPPYLSEEAVIFLRETGVRHLLVDLPSVDKEKDEGKLLAHKAFWNVLDVRSVNPDARFDCTITELVFVPDSVPDGIYFLDLQTAHFVNDAAPSRPVLYPLKNKKSL